MTLMHEYSVTSCMCVNYDEYDYEIFKWKIWRVVECSHAIYTAHWDLLLLHPSNKPVLLKVCVGGIESMT